MKYKYQNKHDIYIYILPSIRARKTNKETEKQREYDAWRSNNVTVTKVTTVYLMARVTITCAGSNARV